MTQNSDLSLRILASLLRFSSYLRTQVFSRLVSEETNCKFRFQWEYLCFVLHLFTYIICWKEIYLQLQTFTSAADDLFFMRTETTEEHDNMKIITIATDRGLKTFWDGTLTSHIVLFQKYLTVLEILIVWFKKVESIQNFLVPISTRLISVLIQITEETIPILKPAENWNSKQSGWVEWKNMFLQKSLI